MIPALTLIRHSFTWNYIWYNLLTFYSGILSDIPFWHSIWYLFWHPIWHPLWHLYSHFLKHSIWHFFCHMFWHTFWHAIWHPIWHSILAFYLASILTFLSRFFVVEVRRGTLWSGARGWGPAGGTLIRGLRCKSSGDHFDPGVAVQVRRRTPRSRACSWGPAGITLIQRLLFGSGGEHRALELAVEVRRGWLWSRYAVRVRQGTLRSRACSWSPAEEEKDEEAAGQLTSNLTTLTW